jgi:hypothetical protein
MIADPSAAASVAGRRHNPFRYGVSFILQVASSTLCRRLGIETLTGAAIGNCPMARELSRRHAREGLKAASALSHL